MIQIHMDDRKTADFQTIINKFSTLFGTGASKFVICKVQLEKLGNTEELQ